MKIQSNLFTVLLCIVLSACGTNATATGEALLTNVYTAAAATIEAQESIATPTVTPTFVAIPTSFTFPSVVPITPTNQSMDLYLSSSTANGCNNATFVSDVTIPDGTILASGESFVKTWEFQNTGTCDWSEDYLLTFVSGDAMDGDDTAIDEDVSVGSAGDLSMSLVAPSTVGTYTGYWRLADEDGNVFGQSVYVMIVVSNDASTTTATGTTTPTSTEEESESTSTPTATTQPTSTFTPTAFPTETPIPTETVSS